MAKKQKKEEEVPTTTQEEVVKTLDVPTSQGETINIPDETKELIRSLLKVLIA